MFLQIGEIDTLNEKYQAQASIESRWSIELDKILPNLSSDEYIENLFHLLNIPNPIGILNYILKML